jgi:hypothetical protein
MKKGNDMLVSCGYAAMSAIEVADTMLMCGVG